MITVNKLYFTYPNGIEAINDISLDIKPGFITGIIGPNGSGKSTLIKCLAGIITPMFGDVIIDDIPVNEQSHRERARHIAYIPQESHIPFQFTALEIVLMGRSPYQKTFAFETKGDVSAALRAMADTETDHFASRPIHELSGGERQRVMLARALAQDPRVMLLDEPTSSLDIRHTVSFYRVLKRRCCRGGFTVVAVMHDINLAALICDRIVILKEGKVISTGRPKEVFTNDILLKAFEINLHIHEFDQTGQPFVLPSLNELHPR